MLWKAEAVKNAAAWLEHSPGCSCGASAVGELLSVSRHLQGLSDPLLRWQLRSGASVDLFSTPKLRYLGNGDSSSWLLSPLSLGSFSLQLPRAVQLALLSALEPLGVQSPAHALHLWQWGVRRERGRHCTKMFRSFPSSQGSTPPFAEAPAA